MFEENLGNKKEVLKQIQPVVEAAAYRKSDM